MSLTLDQANQIIAAAFKQARGAGVKPLAIAVGNLQNMN